MGVRRLIGFTILLSVIAVSPVLAVVMAGDVLERMSRDEQDGYITGSIDTIMYLEQVAARGPTTRSTCIKEWYYGKGTPGPGPRQVMSLFSEHRDKPAVGLIKILIDRACGAK